MLINFVFIEDTELEKEELREWRKRKEVTLSLQLNHSGYSFQNSMQTTLTAMSVL